MTNQSQIATEHFLSCADELITCKFLVAENKIQKLLSALAETPPVYELVSECMEQFNRDREISKAFVQEGHNQFVFVKPEEEFKIIALTFCVLADINGGRLEINDFVKRFFSDTEEPPFKRFVELMILPFRNLIAEAFGYPTIDFTTVTPPAQPIQIDSFRKEDQEEKKEEKPVEEGKTAQILKFPGFVKCNSVESYRGLEKTCSVCQKVALEILQTLESATKHEGLIEELKAICYAILMSTHDCDFDLLRGLTIGLKYASKGVKSIKFYVRELVETVDTFYKAFTSQDPNGPQ